ncbi:MAG: hypothetical protein D6683_13595 [Actinomyces sp.]|nr:MAG: hypothetical protein D6683_13595 [Actinomyces sp.]
MTTIGRGTAGALALAVLLGSACSSGGEDLVPDPDRPPASSPDDSADTSASSDTSGEALVAATTAALSQLRDAYTFVTRVEVTGTPVTTVSGRNIGGNADIVISTDDPSATPVHLIAIGDQVFVENADGTWTLATTASVAQDPIGPLLEPQAMHADGQRVVANYPGPRLGLDDPSVEVDLRLDGASVELVYETEGVAVRTRLDPATDTTPVTAPPTVAP